MLKACYSPRYYAQTHTKSMEKLTAVADVLRAQQMVELIDPGLIDIEILKELHNPQYVEAFVAGESAFATIQGFKPWNEQLRDAILSVQAGQLLGADIAFKEGIAANIAQGFHHAEYDYGGGYCTFNGLALLAQQYPDKRVFVLDCDQHGGNGTAEFTRSLENLFNYTIFGMRYGCREYDRSINAWIPREQGSFVQYQRALEDTFGRILDWKTDLLVYQAGMDCHQLDPFGSAWFDSDSLYQRDLMVFEFLQSFIE